MKRRKVYGRPPIEIRRGRGHSVEGEIRPDDVKVIFFLVRRV